VIPVNRHRIWQLVADAGLIALAWYLAFELRFDQGVPRYYDTLFRRTILIVVAIKLVVFVLFRFYDRWWRYVSIRDMWSAVRGLTAASLVASLAVYFFSPVTQVRLPRSVAVMDWLLLLGLIAGTRLFARSVIERPGTGRLVARGKEVLVVGAGDAGQLTIREMQRNRQLGYTPIGLIDDDPRKKNLRIHGVRVLGTTEELAHILRDNRPDEVLIAIPSASGEARQRIVTVTRENNVPVKTLPGLYELISGETDLATQIRPVPVEAVLGREPVDDDLEASASYH
jgi:FlaA1/EpsC-like NDP-sugar epimerase